MGCDKIEPNPSEFGENIFHVRNRTDLIFGNRHRDVVNMIEQIRYYYNMPDLLQEE
jgi:hypothetical protein